MIRMINPEIEKVRRCFSLLVRKWRVELFLYLEFPRKPQGRKGHRKIGSARDRTQSFRWHSKGPYADLNRKAPTNILLRYR